MHKSEITGHLKVGNFFETNSESPDMFTLLDTYSKTVINNIVLVCECI